MTVVVRSMARIVRTLLLAALLVPATSAAATPKLHGNNFFSNCRFSHTSADDPIALPRLAGRSHAHTFFGNTSTNAYSTLGSLRRAGTTCRPAADKAAYWIPTLYQDGREVRPAKAQAYYLLRGTDQMHPFPAGLRIIAGNAHATRPQSKAVVYWTCGGRAIRTAPSTTPPARCGIVRGLVHLLTPGGKSRPVELSSKSFLELHVNFVQAITREVGFAAKRTSCTAATASQLQRQKLTDRARSAARARDHNVPHLAPSDGLVAAGFGARN